MQLVVPWRELISLITKAAPPKATNRPPFGHEVMLRLHFLQLWFGLSDFAMEEALFDVTLYRAFAGLDNTDRLPDRVSILRFRPPARAAWPDPADPGYGQRHSAQEGADA